MKLKLDSNNNVVVKDGKPVYVHGDGKETVFDAAGTMKSLHQAYFSNSKYVAEKLNIPADMAQAQFRDSFFVEDGKIVAHDRDGNKIYSRSRPGELANFDEALETLVSHYPNKSSILRPVDAPAGGTGGGGKNVIKRPQFDVMPQMDRFAFFKAGGKVVD
jgi:hypothetical protein